MSDNQEELRGGHHARPDETLQLLLTTIPDAVIIIDDEGRIVTANARAEQAFGYERGELTGCPIAALVPDRFREAHARLRARYGGQPRPRPMMPSRHFVALRKDGSELAVEISVAFLEHGGGVLVMNVIRNGSERTRADERLQFQARVLDIVGQAVVATDVLGRVTYWNRIAEAIFAVPVAEAMGAYIFDILPRPVPFDVRRAIVANLFAGEAWSGEFTMVEEDGTELIVSSHVAPIHDENGALSGIITTSSDVTERKRLEERLQQAQRLESIGRLAGGVAHDFNNLMTAIIGHAEVGARELAPGDPVRAELQAIRGTAERAASLTQQLLAFSRRQIVRPRIVSLNEIVAATDAMVRRMIGEDIEMSARLSPDLWPVRVDPDQVERVLVNLAINARDAMLTGGTLLVETANVSLEAPYVASHPAVAPGDYAMVSVSDTGIGMTGDVMEHIFEPFFTTKGFGGGTGLGLSTCFGIIKQAGGHIWAYSEPGVGSTFKVYLPRAAPATQRRLPRHRAPELPRGTETVLLAEDEAIVRRVIVRALRELGYHVLEAEHGGAAIELAREHPGAIDLVLADVVMPGMGGRELRDRLRDVRPGTRILFMSGYTNESALRNGTVEGGERFLSKPFSPALLARHVRETLDA